eukprot:12409366-Alexandrium_andersonii.AAC.1
MRSDIPPNPEDNSGKLQELLQGLQSNLSEFDRQFLIKEVHDLKSEMSAEELTVNLQAFLKHETELKALKKQC